MSNKSQKDARIKANLAAYIDQRTKDGHIVEPSIVAWAAGVSIGQPDDADILLTYVSELEKHRCVD